MGEVPEPVLVTQHHLREGSQGQRLGARLQGGGDRGRGVYPSLYWRFPANKIPKIWLKLKDTLLC